MDESLQEFETELRSLRPRGPSARLLNRIGRELAADPAAPAPRFTAATNFDSWKWLGWRTAGVAAAAALATVAVLFSISRPHAAPGPTVAAAIPTPQPAVETKGSGNRYQPVAATNVLYDLKDEGLVEVEGEAPGHQLRYRYLDTYTWKNPKSKSSLRWSVPRDEIRVLPASLN